MKKRPRSKGDLELVERGEAKNNPQDNLLTALKKGDYESFKELLYCTDVEVDHHYPAPDHGTCIYIAASLGLKDFLELLIEKGADVNGYNNIRKDTPLHAACKEGRPEIVKLLLEHRANTSEKDKFGRQPLHVVVFIDKDKYKDEHLQCLTILLDSGAYMNTKDRSGSTPLHLALIKNNTDAAQTLISKGANADINPASGKTVRELIFKKLPSSLNILPPPGEANEGSIESQLFKCMYNKDLKEFERLLLEAGNKGVNIGTISDGSYNLLQYASKDEGLEGFIEVLLKNPAVNPNGTCKGENWKPLLLAALQGNHIALRLITDHDKTDLTVVDDLRKETALHMATRMERGSQEDMNYLQSVEILTDAMKGNGEDKDPLLHKRRDLNIDAVDAFGNTALHYAARNIESEGREAEEIVLVLLRAGSYIGIKNREFEPAISILSPELIEFYLDESLSAEGTKPWADDYKVIFDYRILIPPCSDSKNTDMKEDPVTFKETELLSYICNNEEYQHLLKHPIFTSFLYLKWHRIRGIFIINLFMYILFVGFMTSYIGIVYGSDMTNNLDKNSPLMQWNDACLYLSTIYLVVLAFLELFQFQMSPRLYIKSPKNYLMVAEIVLSLSMFHISFDHEIEQHLAAIVILLVWIKLAFLIGWLPFLSTYITMFTTVSLNYLKFFLWYAILIIAFALSFFILFRQGKMSDESVTENKQNCFANIGVAMLKTTVMFTGELDYCELPLERYKITSHLIFLLFLFLLSIVLLNLLNGLAVRDTKEVKDKAEFVGYKSRVFLISYMESMLQGKQGKLIYKSSCCCSNFITTHMSFCFKILDFVSPKINIFPELSTINVSVNKRRKISKCCSSIISNIYPCSMDAKVIKEAKKIISKRTIRYSGNNDTEKRLEAIENCLQNILSMISDKHLGNASK